MLPQEFFDWWFTPWAYAGAALPLDPLATGQIGQRDGYRLWCDQAGLMASLPADFDPQWHVAAIQDGTLLITTARLFAGLIATRTHDESQLRQLSMQERRWCGQIAATQPLSAAAAPYTADDCIEIRGLVELGRRLEDAFPGMWDRLQLLLPQELAERSTQLIAAAEKKSEINANRAQRCWTLCHSQAERLQLE